MKPKKVKARVFNEQIGGDVVFDIPGKKVSYQGILEKIESEGALRYAPKIHIHEKSNWCLIFVRPWMNRYTIYCASPVNTEGEAIAFLSVIENKLSSGKSIDEVVENNFENAFRYLD